MFSWPSCFSFLCTKQGMSLILNFIMYTLFGRFFFHKHGAVRWSLDQFWPLVVRCGSVPWKTSVFCFADMLHVLKIRVSKEHFSQTCFLKWNNSCWHYLCVWVNFSFEQRRCERSYSCESAVLSCSVSYLVVGKLDAVLFPANLYWLLQILVVFSMGLCRYSLCFIPPLPHLFFYFPLHFFFLFALWSIRLKWRLRRSKSLRVCPVREVHYSTAT